MRTPFTKLMPAALLLLGSLAAAAQTPGDSIALATAAWRVSHLEDGAECCTAQVELFGSRQSISAVSCPHRSFRAEIVHLDRRGLTTSQIGKAAGAAAAINGSYFNMKTFTPITFVLADKKIVGHTTPGELMRTNGVVALKGRKGRKMAIFSCDTADYPHVAQRYRSALAAGPMLVADGRIVEYDSDDSFYTQRHPRSLIGKRSDGAVVLVVIDGRARGEAAGTTIAQTAFIARQLGLTDALNLDGGGSSALWTARDGIVSHPSDNRRFDHAGERAVPNGIVVKRKR